MVLWLYFGGTLIWVYIFEKYIGNTYDKCHQTSYTVLVVRILGLLGVWGTSKVFLYSQHWVSQLVWVKFHFEGHPSFLTHSFIFLFLCGQNVNFGKLTEILTIKGSTNHGFEKQSKIWPTTPFKCTINQLWTVGTALVLTNRPPQYHPDSNLSPRGSSMDHPGPALCRGTLPW